MGDGLRWVQEVLKKAPSWAASALFHLAVLVAATTVGFATRPAGPSHPGTRTVGVRPPSPAGPVTPPITNHTRVPRVEIPPVDFPGAEEGGHEEVNTGDPFHEPWGPPDVVISGGIRGTDLLAAVVGKTDAIGVGDGGGRPFLSPGRGGKANVTRRRIGNPPTNAAVLAGLCWLARHQDPGGFWSAKGFDVRCGAAPRCGGPGSRDHDVGLTALALLAFLGAGHTPASREAFEDPFDSGRTVRFADAVRRGLQWLKDRQDADGSFTGQEGEFMYDHAIAALAMAEAAWLCGLPLYGEPAQRGVDFLLAAQNPGFAWRYSLRPGDNDTSVTGWCVMALKSAELSGLRLDRAAYEGVRSWLDRVTNSRGVVGYESPGDAGSVIPGVNDRWASHPAMTAVGLLTRIFIEKKRSDPWLKAAASAIVRDLPAWDEEHKTIDFYYWYYAALALFQFDGPSGPAWKAFNESMQKALLPFQRSGEGDCRAGSFDPEVDKWGSIGGRVYATAINVLTLEVYYRYENVFVGTRGAR